jgi:hypothetical protein
MADAYERIASEVLTLGEQHDNTVAALEIANTKETAYLDAIAELQAEIDRLTEPGTPPPSAQRVLDSYLVQGGGGFDWFEVLPDGSIVAGTDVGAHVRFAKGSWEGQKWNAGTSMRHCASGTIDPKNGELISHGGSPGGQEGVFVLDTLAKDWNGPIPGSPLAKVNSQNSYGEPGSTKPGAWPFGYGNNFEQRSVGRLTWRRLNGDLVCGQFGYEKPGGGGVAIIANGAKTVLAGTETWACRAVQRLSDASYAVSTWKADGITSLPSPGGVWLVAPDAPNAAPVRLAMYPDTVEHLDYHAATGQLVAACRNKGVWRDGQDASFNLPKNSEWYSISVRPDGAILAGCMNPVFLDGRYWSVASLAPGASKWVNHTPPPLGKDDPPVPTLNSQEPFVAVNRGNHLGNNGATVCDVGWRGDVPVCTASGILWAAPDGTTMKPAPGSWIIVNKAFDRTADGFEAVAESDFRCHWRKPGKRWDRVNFAGGNEGGDVSWVGHVLHYQGVDGTRQTFNADTGAIANTSAPMPSKNPQGAMPDATRAAILQTIEVQQFGSRTNPAGFAVDAETLIIWGHGGAISRMKA